ncbi:hypothetical protein Bca101_012843 [Brassica carinata]
MRLQRFWKAQNIKKRGELMGVHMILVDEKIWLLFFTLSVYANGDLKSRVTVVGSGNWGSVAAKLIASNALKLPSFHDEVRMWVFEEVLPNGEKLTDVINKTNSKTFSRFSDEALQQHNSTLKRLLRDSCCLKSFLKRSLMISRTSVRLSFNCSSYSI